MEPSGSDQRLILPYANYLVRQNSCILESQNQTTCKVHRTSPGMTSQVCSLVDPQSTLPLLLTPFSTLTLHTAICASTGHAVDSLTLHSSLHSRSEKADKTHFLAWVSEPRIRRLTRSLATIHLQTRTVESGSPIISSRPPSPVPSTPCLPYPTISVLLQAKPRMSHIAYCDISLGHQWTVENV